MATQDAIFRARELPEALAAAGVTLAFGNAAAEYQAAREGAAVAARDDLAHLVLAGRDPVRMIQGLITNDLAGAPDGRLVYGVMLTPKGRAIADLRCWREEGPQGVEVHLDLPREALAAATDHLRRSIPPLYARWRDASEAIGTLGVYGPLSGELLSEALGTRVPPVSEDEMATAPYGSGLVRIAGTRYAGGEAGFDVVAERPLLVELRTRLLELGRERGVLPLGFAALEALRIEAGRPRGGHELTEETIPTEAFESTGLMERAISFSKGCYTGQEVIVRIAHRGHVNRHLRGLLLPAGAAPPSAATRLHHGDSGRDVGWVTSASDSPRMGVAIALAFVRREIEPGQTVRLGSVDGAEAAVIALPFTAVDVG
jgi:folate-binding protein YgfZ